MENGDAHTWSKWRVAAWSIAGLALLLPLAAMRFTDEVAWDMSDFIIAGALIGGTGLTFELVVRKTRSGAYRGGVAVALTAAFLLVWVNGAVGIIGHESNPLNLMYGGLLGIGIVGALVSRFQPRGMAYTMVALATIQAMTAVIALIAGYSVVLLNAFWIALWLISAKLFYHSIQEKPE